MDRKCSWSRIIGLDLSKATFKGCILSGEGFTDRKNFSGEMKQDESGYVLINNTIQAGDIVLMEAGSSSFNLARYLLKNSRANDVVVLNPANLRIIWDSQKKNDKADAMKIACIARDMRPESWPRVTVPSEQEQSERSVIMHWVFLRKQETMLFNRFFALFNSLGYPEIDERDSVRPAAKINGLPELEFGETSANGWIDDETVENPFYIGDGSRFTKADQLLNYAGMVPKQNQSGTVDIKGKITKRGCSAIRRNVVQGAQVVMQLPATCEITKFAYRKKKECPFNGKVAVAVANRMLRTGLSLLHHNDLYRPMIQDGFDRFQRKLAGNKLQALVHYLPSK